MTRYMRLYAKADAPRDIRHQIIIKEYEKGGFWFQDGIPQKKSTIRKYYETRGGLKP